MEKWLEEMDKNTMAPKIYSDENSKDKDFIPDKNGVFHEVYKTLIYHKSRLDRDEFEQWLQGEGGDLLF